MAKRANGEGSIFRRKDGTWSAEASYRDDDGRHKRRTVYGRTQAEVRAKLDEIRERLEAGAPIKDAGMTLTAWLDDWMSKALPASDPQAGDRRPLRHDCPQAPRPDAG
jgi:hypothetical protein